MINESYNDTIENKMNAVVFLGECYVLQWNVMYSGMSCTVDCQVMQWNVMYCGMLCTVECRYCGMLCTVECHHTVECHVHTLE